MAKDPAFLFYSSDFLIGTSLLSNEDCGKYIKILCWLHQHGPVKKEVIENLVGSLSDNLMVKFRLLENGDLVNDRLFDEVEKRKKFTESRRNNGKNGGRKPKINLVDNLKDTHKHNLAENENENENKDEILGLNKFEKIEISAENEYLWTNTKKSFFNDFRWIEKFCRDKLLTQEKLEKLMHEFLNDIELKEDFKELKELKSHFTNWVNLKNKKNGTGNNNSTKLGTSDARIAAITNW